ncbi:condensation domain-containing protein [Kitasatospora sp. NPDC058115]|uniref:condensation domain-containing protein n=1 Tax=Kitasatospora sp. NPDC058115 TaxID=3346347 RepID=UPI0036DF32CD
MAQQVLPLSHTQEAQWFLYRLAPHSGAYNTGLAVRIRSAVDLDRLRHAVAALGERHTMLRSRFDVVGGRPVRIEEPLGEPVLTVRELPGADDPALRAAVREELGRPFVPESGAPFRFVLLTRGPADAVLLVAGHHIATDAASNALLLGDLLKGYEHPAPAGPPPAGRYHDHVDKERRLLASARGTAMGGHWREVCAEVPAAELPADHRRPDSQSFAGDTLRVTVPPELAGPALSAAAEWGVTPYAFLLAAFQVVLHRSTRQREFLIGAPVTTRLSSRMREVVGNFMNTIVLKAAFADGATFRDTAVAANEQIRGGMDAGRYPFPLVARESRSRRAAGRSALFQITFNMLSTAHAAAGLRPLLDTGDEDRVTRCSGLLLSPWHLPQQEGQVDLAVDVLQSAEAFAVDFRYDTRLYERATVERLAGHYLRAVELAARTPDARVATAPLWHPVGTGRPAGLAGLTTTR